MRREIQIAGVSCTIDEFRRLYQALGAVNARAAEIHVSALFKNDEETDEQFEYRKAFVRDSYTLIPWIEYDDGEAMEIKTEVDWDAVKSRSHKIKYINLDSRILYSVRLNGQSPLNFFVLFVDLSRQRLIDWSRPVSNPTENASKLIVSGTDSPWMSNVREIVMNWIDNNPNRRSFIHKAFAYDIALYLFWVPLALAFFSLFYPKLLVWPSERPFLIGFFQIVYTLFSIIWLYRILFGFARWAFPVVEIVSDKSVPQRSRKILTRIVASLIVLIAGILIQRHLF